MNFMRNAREERKMVVNSSRFNFKESIDTMLRHWTEQDVVPNMMRAIREVGRESVKKLKSDSQKFARTGKYAKGWSFKEERGRYKIGGVVYGKSGTYQLAHLINNSHATRNGGRYNPDSEHAHIQPVEDWAINEVFDRFIHYMGGD